MVRDHEHRMVALEAGVTTLYDLLAMVMQDMVTVATAGAQPLPPDLVQRLAAWRVQRAASSGDDAYIRGEGSDPTAGPYVTP